jgi:hypothetical protein
MDTVAIHLAKYQLGDNRPVTASLTVLRSRSTDRHLTRSMPISGPLFLKFPHDVREVPYRACNVVLNDESDSTSCSLSLWHPRGPRRRGERKSNSCFSFIQRSRLSQNHSSRRSCYFYDNPGWRPAFGFSVLATLERLLLVAMRRESMLGRLAI